MAQSPPPTIVVIDDDADYLAFLTALLLRAGYTCRGFGRAQAALEYIRANSVAVVVTDIFMPETDGIEVLGAIRRESPATAVIALSGSDQQYRRIYLNLMQVLGALCELTKPIDPEGLLAAVERCLRPAELG